MHEGVDRHGVSNAVRRSERDVPVWYDLYWHFRRIPQELPAEPMTRDGLHQMSHDHGELNRRVIAIAAQLQQPTSAPRIVAYALVDLRELLFTHFAREEEGLFPFVADRLPDETSRVHAMAVAHDTICGALSRACHLASSDGEMAQLRAIFERFQEAYAAHARAEADLLETLGTKLDVGAREQLAAIVERL